MLKCTFYKDLRTKMISDIAEIYDIDGMSDKERFILLMGFLVLIMIVFYQLSDLLNLHLNHVQSLMYNVSFSYFVMCVCI